MSVRLFTGPWRIRTGIDDNVVAKVESVLRAFVLRVVRTKARDATKLAIDLILIAGAAAWAWFSAFAQVANPGSPFPFLAVVICARLPIYFGLSIHRMPWRKVSRHDVVWLAASALAGPPVMALLFRLLPDPFTLKSLVRPHLILLTEPALYIILLGGVRIGARTIATNQRRFAQQKRTLVVGTGDAARSLVWEIQESATDYHVIGFVDDDPNKQNRRFLGIPVLGTTSDIPELSSHLRVEQILVAIPSLDAHRMREVIAVCETSGASVRILPPLQELISNSVGIGSLREVRMEDLLPRSEVELDYAAVEATLEHRTILVTGGGGSIGRELCRQILKTAVSRLLVLGRGENSVYEAIQELSKLTPNCTVVPVICDVQDSAALRNVFNLYKPHVVFHAAAHKHVPLMEKYPAEAIRNNVLGTLNSVRLSIEFGVERFVLVSTDKAVDPSSVMGSSKRVAEMIVKGYAIAANANMVSVRFGNVLGSRGSVIPLMTRQIANGEPITVTDPEMVRYFMTIPEAAQLILQAASVGGRGEVFVLDMGFPVRIMDLAHDLIRLSGLVPNQDIPIRVTGRRPGEKLREDFLTKLETAGAEKRGQFYVAPIESVSLSDLLTHIQELRMAATANDGERIICTLQALLPSFKPDQSYWALVSGTGGRTATTLGQPQ